MGNCLRPVGVPGSAYLQSFNNSTRPLPNSMNDCMPSQPGAYIQTERDSRRLLHDELCNGLGVPKPWVHEYPDGKTVQQTVALHLLEYLSPSLLRPAVAIPAPVPESSKKPSKTVTNATDVGEYIVFTWKPPDLSPGSPWTRETIKELRSACDTYDNSESMFLDGLESLKRHRGNYDEEGPNPTHLQLLRWEFPPERWDELHDGCSMHFLKYPIPLIQPNLAMTDEQLNISEDFIMELVSLGVLLEVESDYLKTNASTFCLLKPGQPGQWRVLADMKA
jgi:hypothetical protein